MVPDLPDTPVIASDGVDSSAVSGRPLPLDGAEVVTFEAALLHLAGAFPSAPTGVVRSILQSEWETFTGGVPIVVPVGVLDGAAEMLEPYRSVE